MPKLTNSKLPKYSRLSQKNIGFYYKDGSRVYLPGKYGSPESLEAYNKAMASLLEERTDEANKKTASVQKRQLPRSHTQKITVLEMVVEFLEWGKGYYQKNGNPTGTLDDHILAAKPLVDLFGEYLVDKFAQAELIGIQEFLVEHGISRKSINQRIGRIRRIFNWAAGRGLISHDVAGRLKFVESLKPGRTKAPELPPRQAVADAIVEQTLPHLPPVVRDMVQIQRATGMRPGEIFSMTWSQIDTSDDIWLYFINSHKTEHHGRVRIVPLNQKCREILERYRDTEPDQIIFSPKRTLKEKYAVLAAKRKTKRQPSQVKRYNKAEVKAAQEENRNPVLLPMWVPYQLRHTNASNVADVLSIEDARRLLGHSSTATTQIYIHENVEKLKEIARKMEQN